MLLIGALIGALNGALTVLLRVHPLIVTIGMASVLQGAGLLYSLNPPGSVPPEFEGFAYGRVAGVPIAGAIMLAAVPRGRRSFSAPPASAGRSTRSAAIRSRRG